MRRSCWSRAPVWVASLLLSVACGAEPSAPATAPARNVQDAGAKPAHGRWDKARVPPPELSDEQLEAMERLKAIGYLAWSEKPTKASNVTRYDEARVGKGFNLYLSGHAPEATLVDMNGRVLHTWSYEYSEEMLSGVSIRQGPMWHRAHLFPNGDILGVHNDVGLVKLDRDSNVLWEHPGRAHHDLHVMEDGRIYVLMRSKPKMIPRFSTRFPMIEDQISLLDEKGKTLKQVSIIESLEKGNQTAVLAEIREHFTKSHQELSRDVSLKKGDVLHTNSIQVLDGRHADRLPAFKKGNLLISSLTLSRLMVVDFEQEKTVWTLKGAFKLQHHPTLLENGNILLFDNKGGPGGNSAVREIDPVSGRQVWVYEHSPEHEFYSQIIGTCYRLPNGNTLIVESTAGRAFELAPDESIVWEFFNPHRAGERGEFIARLFDLNRLGADFPLGWLESGPVATSPPVD